MDDDGQGLTQVIVCHASLTDYCWYKGYKAPNNAAPRLYSDHVLLVQMDLWADCLISYAYSKEDERIEGWKGIKVLKRL